MFRFILGVVVGFVAARMLRADYVDTRAVERSLAEVQKRAEAVLIESRRVLEEMRHEFASALEASRSSMQEKAERIRAAAAEPEHVISQQEGSEQARPTSRTE